jgi:hypothetical protein
MQDTPSSSDSFYSIYMIYMISPATASEEGSWQILKIICSSGSSRSSRGVITPNSGSTKRTGQEIHHDLQQQQQEQEAEAGGST